MFHLVSSIFGLGLECMLVYVCVYTQTHTVRGVLRGAFEPRRRDETVTPGV